MDTLVCPACGAQNALEAAVCENCGEDLAAVRSVLDNANQHYNEALALAHSNKIDEALGQLEAALALNAEDPQYHNLMGTLYGRKGLYSEAIRAWNNALAIDPEMEKAHRNIERAQDMEAETAEEEERRPLLYLSIGAGALAVLLLLSTLYFGAKVYFQGNSIASLNEQVSKREETIDLVSSQVQEWKTKYEALNSQFPEGGIPELVKQMDQVRGLAEERQNHINRLVEQNRGTVQQLQETIANLQREKGTLQAEAQKSSTLETLLKQSREKVTSLQEDINSKDEQIATINKNLENLRQSLLNAQQDVKRIAQEREEAISGLKRSHERQTAELRDQMLELRDEVASLERTLSDVRYANGLIVEALKNEEQGQFELALQNVQNALERAPQHAAAQYLQEDIQEIINDPVQRAIRTQEIQMAETQRIERSRELATSTITNAREALDKGNYDKAVKLAQDASALAQVANENNLVNESQQIIEQANESKRQLRFQLLEAKREIDEGNISSAQRSLRDILKRAPENEEAKMLMTQIQSS